MYCIVLYCRLQLKTFNQKRMKKTTLCRHSLDVAITGASPRFIQVVPYLEDEDETCCQL